MSGTNPPFLTHILCFNFLISTVSYNALKPHVFNSAYVQMLTLGCMLLGILQDKNACSLAITMRVWEDKWLCGQLEHERHLANGPTK